MKKVYSVIRKFADEMYENGVLETDHHQTPIDEEEYDKFLGDIRNAILSEVSSPDKPLLMISLGVSVLSLRDSVNKLKEEEQKGIGNVSHALKEMGEELYRQLTIRGWTPPVQ